MPKVWEEVRRRVTLGGTVRAPSGDGMGGIAVLATPGEKTRKKAAAGFVANGPTARTVSKDNGCFGFVDLPAGLYRVAARCNAWAADRFATMEGRRDVEIAPFDPSATPLREAPHVEIVLAVCTTDVEVTGRAARKIPAVPSVRLEPACPGTRFIELV